MRLMPVSNAFEERHESIQNWTSGTLTCVRSTISGQFNRDTHLSVLFIATVVDDIFSPNRLEDACTADLQSEALNWLSF